MKRNNIEISKELRLETLRLLLSSKSIDEIAVEFGITSKGLKYRLGLIYKYYKVKNRIELMSLYVNLPLELRKLLLKTDRPVIRSTYKTKEQFGNALPIGLQK